MRPGFLSTRTGPAPLDRLAAALREALDESTRIEVTGGGEADDEEQDALAAEYDEKNG